jgi:hypothetical protein
MGWNPQGMRLRFSLALPAAQLLLAVAMWQWARRTRVPEGLYSPTVDLVSKGINGPALLCKILTLPFHQTPNWPPSILGLTADEFLFFVGVVITWYLVGRALDRYIYSKGSGPTRLTVGQVTTSLLSVLLGIFMFLGTLTCFSNPDQQNNPIGYSALGILLLVWSVFLVGVPALRLAKRILHRATSRSPA